MGNAGYGNHTGDEKSSINPERPEPQADRAAPQKDRSGRDIPAAGPHDKPSLTNPDATPGTGVLPEPGAENGTNSTSG